jgi:hypothetical protein
MAALQDRLRRQHLAIFVYANDLSPRLRKNLTIEHYDAGRMAYIDAASLAKLKADLDRWYDSFTL